MTLLPLSMQSLESSGKINICLGCLMKTSSSNSNSPSRRRIVHNTRYISRYVLYKCIEVFRKIHATGRTNEQWGRNGQCSHMRLFVTSTSFFNKITMHIFIISTIKNSILLERFWYLLLSYRISSNNLRFGACPSIFISSPRSNSCCIIGITKNCRQGFEN